MLPVMPRCPHSHAKSFVEIKSRFTKAEEGSWKMYTGKVLGENLNLVRGLYEKIRKQSGQCAGEAGGHLALLKDNRDTV